MDDPTRSQPTASPVRHLIIWSVAVMVALTIGVGLIFLAVITGGHDYELRHPARIGEDDLGAGLYILLWAFIAFLIAIPLVVFLTRFFARAIHKHFDRA